MKSNYLSLTGYRLPTESETEYATRAKAVTSGYYGETDELLPKYAWYNKNSQEKSWPVGSLKPNDLGLFDVQGNVFTWCQESFKPYPSVKGDLAAEDQEDALVVSSAAGRVLRGGSFDAQASYVRSATRISNVPTFRAYDFGFRPARTLATDRRRGIDEVDIATYWEEGRSTWKRDVLICQVKRPSFHPPTGRLLALPSMSFRSSRGWIAHETNSN